MGIEYQYGSASMYAQAAQMVGEAQEARQTQAVELEKQRQTADIEMMQFREQLGIQAEQRSQQWELQKMEMRSQSDFALEERKRQILAERDLQKEMKLQDEVEAGIKIIQSNNDLSDTQKPDAIYRFRMSKLGYTVPRASDKLDLSHMDLTPDEQVEKPTGMAALRPTQPLKPVQGGIGGLGGGGMMYPYIPSGAKPTVQPSMRLTDSDKEKLQTLDLASQKELETILNSGDTKLIQLALNRIRNL